MVSRIKFEEIIVEAAGKQDTTGSSSSTDYEFTYGSYLKMLEKIWGIPRVFPDTINKQTT